MALLLVSIWHVHTTLYTYLEVGGCLSCYIGLALLLACIWHVSVSGMSSPPTSRQEAAMYWYLCLACTHQVVLVSVPGMYSLGGTGICAWHVLIRWYWYLCLACTH